MELEQQHTDRVSAQSAMDLAAKTLRNMPEIPEGAMQQVLDLIVRSDEQLQALITQLLAGKLAHDFAFRFLASLGQVTSTDDRLPLQPEQVHRLVKRWAAITHYLHVTTPTQFERLVRITTGLQTLMDIASDENKLTWVYDSGIRYAAALNREGYVTAPQHYSGIVPTYTKLTYTTAPTNHVNPQSPPIEVKATALSVKELVDTYR